MLTYYLQSVVPTVLVSVMICWDVVSVILDMSILTANKVHHTTNP